MKRCFLIDSSIYIFRYYFADLPIHLSSSGRNVSTVLAFTGWLFKFLEREQPQTLALCFDESLGSCFRNDIFSDYKCNRSLPDESLAYELLACKKMAQLLGLPVYASEYFEADDLIAALFKRAQEVQYFPVVLTRDKDLGQLLRPDMGLLWDYTYSEPIDYDALRMKMGIDPERIAEYLAIVGDAADFIPGVPGIGKKTVEKLFSYFPSWPILREQLEATPKEIELLPIRGAKRISSLMKTHCSLIERNLQLTQLAENCLEGSEQNLQRKDLGFDALEILLIEFNAPARMMTSLSRLANV